MTLSKQHMHQLQLIKVCPAKLRQDFLRKLPNSGIKAVCECALNAIKGNVPLTSYQKAKLRGHKRTLRKLADKSIPLFKKRRLIVQKGGFLGVLIPAALSVLTSLIK